MFAFLLTGLLLPAPADAAGGRRIGEEVEEAVTLDVTPEGFDMIEAMIPSVVPPTFPIPRFGDYDRSRTCTNPCSVWGGNCQTCVTWYEYEYDIYNGQANLQLNYLDLKPGNDVLELTGRLTIDVNQTGSPGSPPIEPMYIYVMAEVLDLISVTDGTCEMTLDQTTIDLQANVTVDLVSDPVTGDPSLDISIPNISNKSGCGTTNQDCWGWNLNSNKFHLGNCDAANLLDVVNTVLDWFGVNIYDDIIFPMLEGIIDDQINSLLADLPTSLGDSLSALSIEEEVELGDSSMIIRLEPSVLDIKPEGVRIGMSGGFEPTELAECMKPYERNSSLATAGSAPDLAWAPNNLPVEVVPHHIGAFVDDDFLNQAIFSVWYGGLLCYSLSEDDGLPINTSLLGLLAPGVYDDLFPEELPMQIVTRPAEPPEIYVDGPQDINLEVRKLGLDFYGDLDYRASRILAMDLGAEAGVDINVDGVAGLMGIDVALDAEDLTTKVTFNEFTPEANKDIEGSFSGLFDALAGPLLGPLTEDINFGLPAFFGMGITGMAIEPSGPQEDFLGAFVTAGQVDTDTYGQGGGGCEGCGGSGGCEDLGGTNCSDPSSCDATSSCDPNATTCNSGTLPGRSILLVLPFLIAALRRREDPN